MAQMVIPTSQDGREECESESVVGSWHSVRQRLRKLLSNSPIIPSFCKQLHTFSAHMCLRLEGRGQGTATERLTQTTKTY